MWTVDWPKSVNTALIDPNIKRLCEVYAVACMSALTLHRVGSQPVTILPGRVDMVPGRYLRGHLFGEFAYTGFYPYSEYPSLPELVGAGIGDGWQRTEAVGLPMPVAGIVEVKVAGQILPAESYQLEDGHYLVRTDGGHWPVSASEHFEVTYLHGYAVDEMGRHAAGVMANEWLAVITQKGKCRLPTTATSVSRQGVTIERALGMFPENVTGMPEIDAYLMLWNPHRHSVAPTAWSPDLPQNRQVWA